MKDKLFIVRKYVMAKSAAQAIKKERKAVVDDVWLDEDWKKEQNNRADNSVGFKK